MMVLYGVWFEYDTSYDEAESHLVSDPRVTRYNHMYINLAIFVILGLGFVFSFLRHYGISSLGYCFLIVAISLQLTILCNTFFLQVDNKKFEKHALNYQDIVEGLFGSCVVMISFGAFIGKASPLVLIFITFFEILIFSFNYYLCFRIIKALDVGRSMIVHIFGAYFGIALTALFKTKKRPTDYEKYRSDRYSNLFSFFGLLFLWVFWPSFNGVLALPGGRYRAIINTILSLVSSTTATFLFSSILNNGKFQMSHIRTSTFAGGVAIGSAANLYTAPFGAMVVGFISGICSVLGNQYLYPFFFNKLNIQDVSRVQMSHGIPGIIGGIVGIIVTYTSSNDKDLYNGGFEKIFVAKDKYALRQFGALGASLIISIAGGLLIGFILKYFPKLNQPFEDSEYWVKGERKRKSENEKVEDKTNSNTSSNEEIIISQSESIYSSERKKENTTNDSDTDNKTKSSSTSTTSPSENLLTPSTSESDDN
ncbi:rh50 [Anaeramoeba flamelloides]|uniref:Rh50 n=1 Tax=Anaeramoeba flamelloides TaxID=1746091 RepID=A0ABQ8Y6U3_9EUKA|nr:rh50 [Anaeramoeba flamelloides]